MALSDFLYRCPFCGSEPLARSESGASCPGCRRTFEPGSGRGTIRVTEVGGEGSEETARGLAERIAALGLRASEVRAPTPRGPTRAGEGRETRSAAPFESRASMRRAWHEVPVRTSGGDLLGFAERFGEPVKGTLGLSDAGLSFVEDTGTRHEWPIGEIRALQGSSSEIQVSPVSGGVVAFRLPADSPRRWEEALKERLRALWLRQNRGEISEFQPRIRGR